MKITVKATGLLAKHLPAGGSTQGAELEVAEGATPADVIAQLGMPAEGSYLVALNGALVPKAQRAARPLAEHDTLTLMPPLRGG
jgi:sulfur carrier protein ThiS